MIVLGALNVDMLSDRNYARTSDVYAMQVVVLLHLFPYLYCSLLEI